jgi:hypothetical protein
MVAPPEMWLHFRAFLATEPQRSDYTLIYHGNEMFLELTSTFAPKYLEFTTHTRIS